MPDDLKPPDDPWRVPTPDPRRLREQGRREVPPRSELSPGWQAVWSVVRATLVSIGALALGLLVIVGLLLGACFLTVAVMDVR